MNIGQSTSPNFGMKIKGLDRRYFKEVPRKMTANLIEKAEQNTKADFTIEFLPTKDNWVFLKKIDTEGARIVDYFPWQYTPAEVVKTFTKAFIPDNRIMGKSIRKEMNAAEAQRLYKLHTKKI